MVDDPVISRIQAAVALMHDGERDGARQALGRIWQDISAAPRPLHQCVLAHFMADAQDTVEAELSWDLLAYEAATRASDSEAQVFDQSLSIAQFMPSLHLNLADAYHRLDRLEQARTHLAAAQACLKDAPSSPYMDMIRGGVARLASRMGEAANEKGGR